MFIPVERRMRIVGVIDVRAGRAVHAVGGRRVEYAPVAAAGRARVDGDATALARAYVEDIGVRELYVADLDAITGGLARMNRGVVGRIVSIGVPVWVDAGVSTVEEARDVLGMGASIVIVGLETLSSFAALDAICSAVGGGRVAFSTDLREGLPVTLPNAVDESWQVTRIAERAAAAGVGTLVVLDLARVGMRGGVDVELMATVRRVVPGLRLFVGGGVRDDADLERLEGVGCDGALVATALLSGALGRRGPCPLSG